MPNNNKPSFSESEILNTLNSNSYYQRNQIDRYTKFSRFGFLDPYNTNSVTREYLFFTKMDLHLFEPNTQNLNPELSNNPFFTEAHKNFRDTMHQLQWSTRTISKTGPFTNLLSNTVRSKLDLSDISIEELETGANIYGTKLIYPLVTTTSSNAQEFSLEFEDTKFLDVYMFFRIWYEYELLKAGGQVSPPDRNYIINKILHDQMSCYKIVVEEDMQTIVYWAKLWGVYPTSIPRSVFGDSIQDGPIKIPVSFKCQFVEDMDPSILSDFNKIVDYQLKTFTRDIPIYNTTSEMANGEWVNVPYVVSSTLNGRRVYKLKWR